MADVACGRRLLLGSAKVLRSLKFATEENWLSDSARKSPEESIERPNGVEVRGSESAGGAKHKAWQASGAGLVHPVKGGGETALARDKVGPAFEDLCRQTSGNGSRLGRERPSR